MNEKLRGREWIVIIAVLGFVITLVVIALLTQLAPYLA
jgi:hypothetical protein